MKYGFLFVSIIISIVACKNDTMPKPKGFLRLDYPQPNYKISESNIPFTFEKNELASQIIISPLKSDTKSYGITIAYPNLKGTIYLTYKAINNNKNYLIAYLKDAQNFTQEHTQKANGITEQLYKNDQQRVFGMLYEVSGNAASQSQFYVTDSVNHFLTGSLYFYQKPNYDSILPAATYLKNDIKHLMETIQWKN